MKPGITKETHELAGTGYDGRPEPIAELSKGQAVTLVRQPENPHDELAIDVQDDKGRSLGYIPAEEALILSPKIDDGLLKVVSAEITRLWKGPSWSNGPGVTISVTYDMANPAPIPKTPPAPETGWASANGAGGTFFAITADGVAWARGHNGSGTCGVGDTQPRDKGLVPVHEGAWRDIASGGMGEAFGLRDDGTIWCWGHNRWRHLGEGARRPEQLVPFPFAIGGSWMSFAMCSSASLKLAGIREDGTLWKWGYLEGNDGPGGAPSQSFNAEPVQVGTESGWASVSAGGSFFMAVREDGTLWTWGDNWEGALGLGKVKRTEALTQVGRSSDWAKVAAGYNFCVGLKTDGSLWGWGDNQWWQLGLGGGGGYYEDEEDDGSDRPRRTPTALKVRGASFTDVAVGDQYAVAIDSKGDLWTWGHSPSDVHWRTRERITSPGRVPGGGKWRSVHPGCYAIREDGSLWEVPPNLFDDSVPERVG